MKVIIQSPLPASYNSIPILFLYFLVCHSYISSVSCIIQFNVSYSLIQWRSIVQFNGVAKQFNGVAKQFSGVAKQFNGVAKQFNEVKHNSMKFQNNLMKPKTIQ